MPTVYRGSSLDFETKILCLLYSLVVLRRNSHTPVPCVEWQLSQAGQHRSPTGSQQHVQISLYLQPNDHHSKTTTDSASQAYFLTGSQSLIFLFIRLILFLIQMCCSVSYPHFFCIQIKFTTKLERLMMFFIPLE